MKMRKLLFTALTCELAISLIIVSNASAQTYFADNFDRPDISKEQWVDIYGQWEFKDKEYHQLMNAVNCMSLVADDYWKDEWNDYKFEVRGNKISGAEGFLIMFRCMGRMQERGVVLRDHPARMQENKVSLEYWWNIGGWGNTTSKVESWGGTASPNHPDTVTTGEWYDIKIVNTPKDYTLYLNGKEILSVSDSTQEGRGRIGLATWSTLARFDDVMIYGPNGPGQAVDPYEKTVMTWGNIKSGR